MFRKMLRKYFLKTNTTFPVKQFRGLKNLSLKFFSNGEPIKVLQMVEEDVAKPKDFEVLIKVLMAPINPSDLNIIQGRYPLQPAKLPAVGGNEFVGEIVEMGEKVENFNLGEHVVSYETGLGTWSKYLLLEAQQIFAVPYKLTLPEAATLTVNSCTAYRMLKDFVHLKPGDCIIQNGANSAVGQAVHQFCRIWGIKSLGIVRDRSDIAKLKQNLIRLGATEILTEEELLKTTIFKDYCLPKPHLALNCVGGESAKNIAKFLDNQSVMITYGGMSRKPLTIATGPLIFKKHIFRGFWITDWIKENAKSNQRTEMLNNIIELVLNKEFVAPNHVLIPFEEYEAYGPKALTLPNKLNKKCIFDMSV